MERIAEAIIKRNIHIIENELDTINRIEIIYLIFLLVKLLTNALIDDNYCFICLKCIFKKTTLNFDFDEAYCILDMMNKNLHKYSYRIITLKYNNDLYIDRFYLSLQIFKKTDGYINKYFVDIVDNDIEKFKDIFLNKIQILIQAFDERKK